MIVIRRHEPQGPEEGHLLQPGGEERLSAGKEEVWRQESSSRKHMRIAWGVNRIVVLSCLDLLMTFYCKQHTNPSNCPDPVFTYFPNTIVLHSSPFPLAYPFPGLLCTLDLPVLSQTQSFYTSSFSDFSSLLFFLCSWDLARTKFPASCPWSYSLSHFPFVTFKVLVSTWWSIHNLSIYLSVCLYPSVHLPIHLSPTTHWNGSLPWAPDFVSCILHPGVKSRPLYMSDEQPAASGALEEKLPTAPGEPSEGRRTRGGVSR